MVRGDSDRDEGGFFLRFEGAYDSFSGNGESASRGSAGFQNREVIKESPENR